MAAEPSETPALQEGAGAIVAVHHPQLSALQSFILLRTIEQFEDEDEEEEEENEVRARKENEEAEEDADNTICILSAIAMHEVAKLSGPSFGAKMREATLQMLRETELRGGSLPGRVIVEECAQVSRNQNKVDICYVYR